MALTPSELDAIGQELGPRSKIIVSGVSELYFASPNLSLKDSEIQKRYPKMASGGWVNANLTGALLLVHKKRKLRSGNGHLKLKDKLLLMIYHLETFKKRFSFEIYVDMEYEQHSEHFFSFEIDDCIAGVNFSSEKVARKFYMAVQALRPVKVQKKPLFFQRLLGSQKTFNITSAKDAGLIIRRPSKVSFTTGSVASDGLDRVDAANLPTDFKLVLKDAGIKKKDWQDKNKRSVILQTVRNSIRPEMMPPPGQFMNPYRSENKAGSAEGSVGKTASHGVSPEEEAVDRFLDFQATMARPTKDNGGRARSLPKLPPRREGSKVFSNAGTSASPKKFKPKPPALPPPPELTQVPVPPPVSAPPMPSMPPRPPKPPAQNSNNKPMLQPKGSKNDFLRDMMQVKLNPVGSPKLLGRLSVKKRNSLVDKLKQAMMERRQAVDEVNDSDEDDDWD